MKSYFLKDVVVVENFRRLFLRRFLVDFKCPAPYPERDSLTLFSSFSQNRVTGVELSDRSDFR